MNPTKVILDCDPAEIEENIRLLEERLLLWKTLRALRRVLAGNRQGAMPPSIEAAVTRQVETLPAARRLRSQSHARAGERDEQIAAILEAASGGLTARQIAENLDISRSHAHYFLKRMEANKRVAQFEGKWFLQRAPGAEPLVVAAGEAD